MDLFFYENDPFAPIQYTYRVDQVICHRKTKHQDLVIFQNPYFGRVLALDGVVQLTERDEHFYHEMLAHVGLHAHPRPVDVLIIGGGDGGTLREVVKHDCVSKIVMVELDSGVIEASREYLPALSTGFGDPRLQVIEAEGSRYLAETHESFDLIIMDSTDPVGPAMSLFTSECFSSAFSALRADGMLVGQTESLHFHQSFIREVQRRLRLVFKMVDLYTVPLTTYAGNWWTFSIASKLHDPRQLSREIQVSTKYYAADVHRHAFLPASVYNRLVDESF